jgi:transposase-like protein
MAGEATRRRSIRPGCEHTFVIYPAYIREKARRMRVERQLTVNEIAERLGIAKSTIFYWVGDLPIDRERAGID